MLKQFDDNTNINMAHDIGDTEIVQAVEAIEKKNREDMIKERYKNIILTTTMIFLKSKIYKDISMEKCYGCIYNRPGQRDHECLMTPVEDFIDRYYNEMIEYMFKEMYLIRDIPLGYLQQETECNQQLETSLWNMVESNDDNYIFSKEWKEETKHRLIEELKN